MIRRFASLGRYGILLVLAGCASTPRIVGPVRPAIRANQVMIFTPPLVPKHYVVVAKLDGSGFGGYSDLSYDSSLLRKLRREAARLGANGLLLVPFGHSRIPSAMLKLRRRKVKRCTPWWGPHACVLHGPRAPRGATGSLDGPFAPRWPGISVIEAIEVPHWKKRDLKRELKLLKGRP